jgi:hypothetical protein
MKVKRLLNNLQALMTQRLPDNLGNKFNQVNQITYRSQYPLLQNHQ